MPAPVLRPRRFFEVPTAVPARRCAIVKRPHPNEREEAAGLAPTPGYRYAEVVGRELFVAGQVPHDGEGNLVSPGDARRQAQQCLANLMALLDVHGFEARNVRHLRIYAAGGEHALRDAWTGVTEWFDDDVPPATLLGVNELGYLGQVVEIEATVVRD
jgi:enamine deaminase RidA (YjgF/YER057c/UK114 family)